MADPVPEDTLAKIEAGFMEGRTFSSLSRDFRVSEVTIRKYRRALKWDERKGQIAKRAAKRVDATRVERKARQTKLALLLQTKGDSAISRVENPIKIRRYGDAIKSIVEGVKLEREITGDDKEGTADLTITISMPKDLEGIN